MTDTPSELLSIADHVEKLVARSQNPDIYEPIQSLSRAANEVGQAWSGSWIGYHAYVYYRDLRSRPPGAHFSADWGSRNTTVLQGTTGDWVEHDPELVTRAIHRWAGNPDLDPVEDLTQKLNAEFSIYKTNLLSIVDIETRRSNSTFMADQRKSLAKLSTVAESDIIKALSPKQLRSRDTLALSQGLWTPPHIQVLAQVSSVQATIKAMKSLADIARVTASHIRREQRQPDLGGPKKDRVFIGHGRSHIWRELKDFLEDQLALHVDEFNRVPVAGRSTVDRLQNMLSSAAIAFLVMTGEDEQPDGRLRARENVVHEAGLFQGHLGFERAILLLEESCQKFSNNAGLIHIDFPKNNIRAAFQDVREVLEREGVISTRVAQ